jgi:hypothetical protein
MSITIRIDNLDWEMLREQKEFCLNHGADVPMGLAHFLDFIQDSAVAQGYTLEEVFGDLLENNND